MFSSEIRWVCDRSRIEITQCVRVQTLRVVQKLMSLAGIVRICCSLAHCW